MFDEGTVAGGKPLVYHLMNEDLKNAYELAGGRNQSAVLDFMTDPVKKTFALEINRFTASQKRNFSFCFERFKGYISNVISIYCKMCFWVILLCNSNIY